MDCERFQYLISLAEDEALGEGDARSLSSHIGTCPECGSFRQDVRRIIGAVEEGRSCGSVDPSDVADAVMKRIRLHDKGRRSFRRRFVLACTAAVAGAAAAAGILVFVPWPALRPATSPAPSVNDAPADRGARAEASGGEWLAELSEATGPVEVLNAGAPEWSGAKPGQRLVAGDILRTGREGGALLALRDGSMVTANLNTRIRLDPPASEVRQTVRLLEGDIFVDAAKGDLRLNIATPLAAVKVLGTKFGVSLTRDSEGSVAVTVSEGAVELMADAWRHVVNAGSRGLVRPGFPVLVEEVDVRKCHKWLGETGIRCHREGRCREAGAGDHHRR